MTTVYVWMLVLYMSGSNISSGGPMVVDNISTKEECLRVQKLMREAPGVRYQYSRCIEVQKMVVRNEHHQ